MAVLICGFLIRGFKVATDHFEYPLWATPVSHGIGALLPDWANGATWVALVKIYISMAWLITIALNVTMGVAWHRFLAFFNIFFKRGAGEAGRLRPGRAAADDERGQAARLRGGRPGEGPVRRRPGRAVHLEGPAGLLHLHGVRPLPVAVPGLEHRQAALAEAAGPVAARPRVREGALSARRRRQGSDRRGEGHRGPARAHGRAGAGRGQPAADRHRGRAGRHRPRRALVLHHLRRLRRAVPGGHRARRPHRGHAPLPGADRVELPARGRRDAAQPGEQGQPVGFAAEHPRGLDQGPRLPRAAGRPRWTTSSTCSGSAAPERSRTGPRRPPGRSPRCCNEAGVNYAILGEGETCTGDPARRIGNEFVFQMLAQQNVETLNEAKRQEDRRHLPALLQHPGQRVRAARRQVRGRAPHPAAGPPGRRPAS